MSLLHAVEESVCLPTIILTIHICITVFLFHPTLSKCKSVGLVTHCFLLCGPPVVVSGDPPVQPRTNGDLPFFPHSLRLCDRAPTQLATNVTTHKHYGPD